MASTAKVSDPVETDAAHRRVSEMLLQATEAALHKQSNCEKWHLRCRNLATLVDKRVWLLRKQSQTQALLVAIAPYHTDAGAADADSEGSSAQSSAAIRKIHGKTRKYCIHREHILVDLLHRQQNQV